MQGLSYQKDYATRGLALPLLEEEPWALDPAGAVLYYISGLEIVQAVPQHMTVLQ